jgi:tetrahydromethanopterin S-methyltransferase subunit G
MTEKDDADFRSMFIRFGELLSRVESMEKSLQRIEDQRNKKWGQLGGIVGGFSVAIITIVVGAWNLTVNVNQVQRDVQSLRDSITLAKKSTDDELALTKQQEEEYAKKLTNDLRYETQRRLPKSSHD